MDTAVWLWRMRHPTLPMEFGYRIARPLPEDDRLFAAVTVDGRVLRTADGGHRLFTFARRLERLLSMGACIQAELRAHGFVDVEEDR